MAKLKGKDLLLIIGDTVVALAKDCNIEYSSDTIEVSSPTSGTARDYIPGRTAWSASCNTLVSADATVQSLRTNFFLKVGKTVDMKLWPRGKTAMAIGSAICTKYAISAQVGQMVQGSFAFQGTGPLMGL